MITCAIFKLYMKGTIKSGLLTRSRIYRRGMVFTMLGVSNEVCNSIFPNVPIYQQCFNSNFFKPIYTAMISPFTFSLTRIFSIPFNLCVKPEYLENNGFFTQIIRLYIKEVKMNYLSFLVRVTTGAVYALTIGAIVKSDSLIKKIIDAMAIASIAQFIYYPIGNRIYGTTMEMTIAKAKDEAIFMLICTTNGEILEAIYKLIAKFFRKEKKEDANNEEKKKENVKTITEEKEEAKIEKKTNNNDDGVEKRKKK